MFNFLRKKRKYKDYDINPDEIFLDTLNISRLNKQQFEGVIEKPISAKNIVITGVIFSFVFLVFFLKLFSLQIIQGETFYEKSEKNLLRKKPIFAERGIIYDRNNKELAWNRKEEGAEFLYRDYIKESGFGHIIGYVNYPKADDKGVFWRTQIAGQAGLEKKYNQSLSGKNGAQLFEVNANGKIISQNKTRDALVGENIVTTIDASLQHYLFEAIKKQAESFNFIAGSGGIMDIHDGELLALVSYPEYDPYTLAEGKDGEKIQSFFNAENKPFLNRMISGLYSPGSIVKPFLALGALDDGIINKNTQILSVGKIEIPNRYNPNKPSIFRDWKKGGHGLTNVTKAIAESVNTFFYAIGGGYKNQKGLGIQKIVTYLHAFDIAEKTGIQFGKEHKGTIPSPQWKKEHYKDGRWRIGDTYITSIGQFGFQVSPIQMLRSVSAIANEGKLLEPLLVKGEKKEEKVRIPISSKNYKIIQKAMRATVTQGTAQNINVPYMDFAAKTGTAQVGQHNEFYNSWIIGFFPAEKPQYAFVISMERGDKGKSGSASRAMRDFILSMEEHYPQFLKGIKK